DGKTLASGGRDGAIRLWDVATWKECVSVQQSIDCRIDDMAFSPDGKTLAVMSSSRMRPVPAGEQANRVTLWDPASGQLRGRLEVPNRWVKAMAFSPDGRTLATANAVYPDPKNWEKVTGEVWLWDTATGQPRRAPMTFDHSGETLAFGGRGRILA